MKALVFGVHAEPQTPPAEDAPQLLHNLAKTPMALQEIDEPKVLGPDWTVLRTRMTGICGSDAKQAMLDFDDLAGDNPMSAFISFPQVMGHEVVATVEEAGPEAGLEPGQRVVLNPWLSCAPRGIEPVCPACEAGDYSLCWNFNDGRLTAGIHTGNSSDASGGFADLLPAHRQMAIPVPDEIPDEVAVLADPFAVSLHAITRNPPPEGGRALIYGAGALGTTAGAILAELFPSVDVGVVARFDHQADVARRRGATVFAPEPRLELIEALAAWSGGILRTPWDGLPTCHPGHVDVVYDTVGAPETVEVGIRVLAERGTLVQMGVSSPARFEWTPWYFKELRLVGSNAFGIEEVDGIRQHGIAHYLDLVQAGRVDLDGMLTHTFRLEEWRQALAALADQATSGALKVAFDFR